MKIFSWLIDIVGIKIKWIKLYFLTATKYDSTLEEYGYITGKLDKKSTDLLMNIFSSCEKVKFDPFDQPAVEQVKINTKRLLN